MAEASGVVELDDEVVQQFIERNGADSCNKYYI
jgi:hypothetical protein